MYVGKTLFAQVMEFVPWTSFSRIVHRYQGNAGVRTLATGAFGPIWRRCSSGGHANSMSIKRLPSIWTAPSMRSIRAPSICA